MAFKSLQRRLKKEEAGFVLMEAVTAAGFAAVALSASLFILNKQIEIADRARGLAMVQAAINEDMNAVRHYARKWNWTNNPAGTATTPPNMLLYNNIDTECHAFDHIMPGKFEHMALTDFVQYGKLPGELTISNAKRPISKTVPGFQIIRSFTRPSVESQINPSATFSEEKEYTLRVKYSVNRVRTGKNGSITLTPFPYTQTADIQFYAQFSC